MKDEEITYRGKKLSDCSQEELIQAVEKLFREIKQHTENSLFIRKIQEHKPKSGKLLDVD